MKKTFRVSFDIDQDKLGTVLALVIPEVSHLQVAESNAPIEPRYKTRRIRRNGHLPEGDIAPDNVTEIKNDPLMVAKSPVGKTILDYLKQHHKGTTAIIGAMLHNSGRWSAASASPTLSRLQRGGYVRKEDPRPGAPYIYVKSPD